MSFFPVCFSIALKFKHATNTFDASSSNLEKHQYSYILIIIVLLLHFLSSKFMLVRVKLNLLVIIELLPNWKWQWNTDMFFLKRLHYNADFFILNIIIIIIFSNFIISYYTSFFSFSFIVEGVAMSDKYKCYTKLTLYIQIFDSTSPSQCRCRYLDHTLSLIIVQTKNFFRRSE